MTTTYAVATIANKLGYDVDIYDVFNPNSGPNGPLTYTKLGTVPNSSTGTKVTTIRFASQLQAMRTGNITALNNNYYIQFPVAVLAVSPFTAPNTFTLTTAMQQAMEQSFKFIKFSQANPTSALAKGFTTAVGNTTNQATAVNTFFAGTSSFPLCTMSTWNAVMNWQTQFTNAWQGTYYLYSTGTGSAPVALVATLAILCSTTADSAVLTMDGTMTGNVNIVQAGDGTMQDQNPGSDSLSVTLTPTWMNVTQTTQQNGQNVTSSVIEGVFTGTINGLAVTGNLNQIALPSPSDSSQSAADQWKAAQGIIGSITGLAGLLISCAMLAVMIRGHKNGEIQTKNDVQEKAKNKADAESREQSVNEEYQGNDVPLVAKQAQSVETQTVPQVQDAQTQADLAQSAASEVGVVNAQINKVENIMENNVPDEDLEDAGEDLLAARSKAEAAIDPNTSLPDKAADVQEVSNDLANTGQKLNTEEVNNANKNSQEENQEVKASEDAVDAEKTQADEEQKDQEEQRANDDKPADDENANDDDGEAEGEIIGEG